MAINFNTIIKKLPAGKREITVELAPPEVEECYQKALRNLATELEIEGFRKGKVPPAMAEKYIKHGALLEEAAHVAIRETYPLVVEHHGIEPVGDPEVEVTKIAKGDAMSYRVRTAVV